MPQVNSFQEISEDFHQAVSKIVWCNVATINTQGRPTSRVLHPMWEGSTGWIMTGRNSLKSKHLANNPYISLAYVAEPMKPIYVDAKAEWIDDLGEKQRIWDLFKNTPEPYGYDGAPFFGSYDSPGFGILKLTPQRIELYDLFGQDKKIWQAV